MTTQIWVEDFSYASCSPTPKNIVFHRFSPGLRVCGFWLENRSYDSKFNLCPSGERWEWALTLQEDNRLARKNDGGVGVVRTRSRALEQELTSCLPWVSCFEDESGAKLMEFLLGAELAGPGPVGRYPVGFVSGRGGVPYTAETAKGRAQPSVHFEEPTSCF